MSQPGKVPAQAPEYQYDALPDGQSIRMLTLYLGALDDSLEGDNPLYYEESGWDGRCLKLDCTVE
jgi:hypothetical protein